MLLIPRRQGRALCIGGHRQRDRFFSGKGFRSRAPACELGGAVPVPRPPQSTTARSRPSPADPRLVRYTACARAFVHARRCTCHTLARGLTVHVYVGVCSKCQVLPVIYWCLNVHDVHTISIVGMLTSTVTVAKHPQTRANPGLPMAAQPLRAVHPASRAVQATMRRRRRWSCHGRRRRGGQNDQTRALIRVVLQGEALLFVVFGMTPAARARGRGRGLGLD